MKNKSVSQSILIWLFTVAAFALCNSPAQASITTWMVGTGDWFICTNWSNGCPDSSKEARINNGGTAQINSSGAIAQYLILGFNPADSGTVTVNGGGLVVSQDVSVGYSGRGTLNITNGGTVTSQYGYIAEVRGNGLVGSNGAVTVDGASSTWTIGGSFTAQLFIGGSPGDVGGTALVNLKNDATVIVSNTQGHQTPVTLGTSGTVTGRGSITTMGSVNPLIVGKGTLAPMGAIKVVGDLTLTSSAKTTCNVTPSAADTVTVDGTGPASGAATLNGHLSVNMTGDFSSAPTRYTLLHAAGGLGNTKFQTLSITYPTGLGWTPQITYDDDGGNVFLDRVYDLNP